LAEPTQRKDGSTRLRAEQEQESPFWPQCDLRSAYDPCAVTLDMNTPMQKMYRQFRTSEADEYMPAYCNCW